MNNPERSDFDDLGSTTEIWRSLTLSFNHWLLDNPMVVWAAGVACVCTLACVVWA